MSKKLILVLVVFVFFFKFNLAQADVIIDEFVSHPNTGENEWVELFNNGGSSQDLSGWKLTELTSPNTTPVEVAWGPILSGNIPANGVLVFEVSGSKLNDGGDSIGLYDNSGNPVYRVTYGTASTVKNYSINLAAPSIGKSGALISGVWETDQDPTKGMVNPIPTSVPIGEGSLVSDNSNNNTSSSTSTTSATTTIATTETKSKVVEEPKIKTQITAKTLAFVGNPVEFKAGATGYSNEVLHFGKYFWNFGDGDSKEVNLADSQPFSRTYFYPGDYIVSLDYYSSNYEDVPDASDQITIKIIPADISISKVGDEKDFFVELTNNTGYSADISNWFLLSDAKSFMIPRDTILASKKTMIISPQITGFSIADKDTLKLMTPEREVAFDYAASVVPVPTGAENTVVGQDLTTAIAPTPSSVLPLAKGEMPKAEGVNSETDLPAQAGISAVNLAASAVSSTVATNDGTGSPQANSPARTGIILAVSFVFIGAAAAGVYFVRRKKIIPRAGNDFEILDE
jgi:hypothetical protein